MDVLRKNTDYALRMMGNLAGNFGKGTVSVRMLARQEDVSYQFACKILQKLQAAGLVASAMGPTGGYQLCREPDQISMLDVIRAMQGDIMINRCSKGSGKCPRQSKCGVSGKLSQLQQQVEDFLTNVKLHELL